jgi:hypothetical protein
MLEELNDAIEERVWEVNHDLRRADGSTRWDRFTDEEQALLGPLPAASEGPHIRMVSSNVTRSGVRALIGPLASAQLYGVEAAAEPSHGGPVRGLGRSTCSPWPTRTRNWAETLSTALGGPAGGGTRPRAYHRRRRGGRWTKRHFALSSDIFLTEQQRRTRNGPQTTEVV